LVKAADILITTPVCIGLALGGTTLWALLASNVSTALVYTVGLYIWKPIWRPRLIWHPAGMRYFLRFGSRMAFATWLVRALDNVDDLWTGVFISQQALGLYSRAYSLAKLPSMLLAGPVSTVAAGVYAEITGNRKSLSRAFLLTNAAMVRTGFLLAGMLALVAPELISLLIGERWLPAVVAFRLMLVYALFEPMKGNIGHLFAAVGNPGLLGRLRFIQLVVLIVGLFALGTPFGIEGVALAVDLMLMVGIFMMLHHARRYVDFSLRDLFLVPCLAVIAGLSSSVGLTVAAAALSTWLLAAGKLVIFAAVYGLILVIADRRLIGQLLSVGRNHLRKQPRPV
jgi:O-antigen/teichoic acid export membrane protein